MKRTCLVSTLLVSTILLLGNGCNSYHQSSGIPVLTSINFIDYNGLSETLTTPDRLKQYEQVDFLKPQPFQKIMRVYSRDREGNISAVITSYHPNGQTQQYLEVVNNRASGFYREWHPNGILKLETYVIGGMADITAGAEKSWLFEGVSTAWNENGCLLAEIPYSKGELEGISLYFHPSGNLWKRAPFCGGVLNGLQETFLDNGEVLQTTEYVNGVKSGVSKRYWCGGILASEETYMQGLLKEGRYYNLLSEELSAVKNGNGFRAVFGRDTVAEFHEYKNGQQEGLVKVFSPDQKLMGTYHMKNGQKHGEEIEYYEKPSLRQALQPKLSINWYEDTIQGVAKTWYDNGALESQREMSTNQKNGLATAWYRDGSLMMIEEYDHDKLTKGEYYKRGEKIPMSEVSSGKGNVTLFDAEGNFLRKITYFNGRPL